MEKTSERNWNLGKGPGKRREGGRGGGGKKQSWDLSFTHY